MASEAESFLAVANAELSAFVRGFTAVEVGAAVVVGVEAATGGVEFDTPGDESGGVDAAGTDEALSVSTGAGGGLMTGCGVAAGGVAATDDCGLTTGPFGFVAERSSIVKAPTRPAAPTATNVQTSGLGMPSLELEPPRTLKNPPPEELRTGARVLFSSCAAFSASAMRLTA